MSWNQGFATDYQERGNIPPSQPYPSYQNPVYPSSPTSKTPTYNRSPAPFQPSQGQVYQQPAMNGHPATQQPPFNPPPYQAQPSGPMSQSFEAQVVDKREQPEMDEDFPSYKDLRNVFLQKQQQAEVEERRASTLPRQQFGRTSIQSNQPGRKPPPTPSKKPVSLVSPGSPSRNRVITQSSSSYQQQSQSPQTPTSKTTVQVTSQARSNYPGQQQTSTTYQQPANTYTEIPVQHVTGTTERTQVYETPQAPRRVELGYRPPMSINVTSPYTGPSYDSSSPRVKITSNSPMSPQRAWYRPDNDTENLIIPRQMDRRHSVSFAPMMMSSSANQPRRRTSYAEIFIGSTPQSVMPRDLSASSPGLVQRSFTRVTTNRVVNGVPDVEQEESFPSFRELKSQFSRQESNDLSRGQRVEPFGVTYSTRQNHQQNGDFTRVNMRRSSQQSNVQPEMMQRQAPGWSATVQTGAGGTQPVISTGPNIHYIPSARQPGKTAAHLQYNSPMGLYSTSNAQEALDRDPEAAELLKIQGQHGNQTLINSPTLKAVLKEDSIKRQTGRKANISYYLNHLEYGPGIGPLRQYEEVPDTLGQSITLYNQNQDRSLTYPMWSAL